MELTTTEENYLKAILKISWEEESDNIRSNTLANFLGVKPASANEMLKKLKSKNLIEQEKYGKIALTDEGRLFAIDIIRKHRIWETFLYEKLQFTWDEVHDVAEQLEHIQSPKLIEKLYLYLGKPTIDPHGDPIPDEQGNIQKVEKMTLTEVPVGKSCKMVAVKDNSSPFLQYLIHLGIELQDHIKVISRAEFDGLCTIEVADHTHIVSEKFSNNIWVIAVE